MLEVITDTPAAGTNGAVSTGADAQIIGANSERNGLFIQAAVSNTGTVFLLLVSPTGAGAASTLNAHIELAAGQSWAGLVGGTVWAGKVRAFSAAAQALRVLEV